MDQKKWCPELDENGRNVPKILVGNKIDLRDEDDAAPVGKPSYIGFKTVKKPRNSAFFLFWTQGQKSYLRNGI